MRPDQQLSIKVVAGKADVTLHVEGEIDTWTAPVLREATLTAMRHHSAALHLDMSGVRFMDSTGLEVLLATRRRIRLEGGTLKIINPTQPVLRVLVVTGIDRLFDILTIDGPTAASVA